MKMELNEALEKLQSAGALVESTRSIPLEEFNRRIKRFDKGWVLGKLNDNRNPSAPWTMTKEGLGQIKFSTLVYEDNDGEKPVLRVVVRPLGYEPADDKPFNVNRVKNVYNAIFNDIWKIEQ